MRTLTLDNNTSNKRMITLLILLLLSSLGMFGQEVATDTATPVATTVVSGFESDSEMELVSWLMVSKQVQGNAGKVSNTTSTNNSSKKQMINSGMKPNRILSRAFMKKAVNYDSTVA